MLQGFTVGFTVSMYDLVVVLQALVLTMSVVVSLTAFTMQSKYDFSKCGAAYVHNSLCSTCVNLNGIEVRKIHYVVYAYVGCLRFWTCSLLR